MVSIGVTRRLLVLALIASCDAPAPPVVGPPPAWVYAPAPSGWPLGAPQGRFGRAQAPEPLVSLGIGGAPKSPLRLATLWDVPGGPSARAAVYGYEGARAAVELIDVDAGRVLWRETGLCAGPIVGVTEEAIVCSDGTGVRGVKLDGKTAWRVELPFVAMSEDRVVVAADAQVAIVDAATGDELSRVKMPAGVMAETVVASCGDAGRELFLAGADRMLARVADVKGKPAVTWRAPLGAFEAIDACEGEHVLVKASGALVSFARATGAVAGTIADVRGWWRARDGSDRVEVATLGGVASWTRALADSRAELALPLGELVSTRGDRRLVRATPQTMVLLDHAGVASYVALAAHTAVLGQSSLVGADWDGSRANAIERVALPERYRRALRLSLPSPGVAVPTELRDLAPLADLPTDDALTKAGAGTASVGPVAIDPAAPNVIYVVAGDKPIDDDTPQAIAALDLATKAWRWLRADGCGPGTVTALAVTTDLVVCATQGTRPGSGLVRTTTRAGQPRWEWDGEGVDHVVTGASLIAISAGDRAYVLDGAGRQRLVLATHDGALPVAIVDTPAWGPLVIAVQHGRLVARAANLDMLPVWTLAIDGVATAVQRAGDSVLVQLEDGDAYLVAARDGAITAVPGIGLSWQTGADLLAGLVAGGPLYGAPLPVAKPRVPVIRGPVRKRPAPDDPEQPSLWTALPLPPVIGAGQQLTIYEPSGGVRVRAEYELGRATWAPRGPAGSPIVLAADTPEHQVIVIDPRTGAPHQRYRLVGGEALFSTVVNGSPVAGVVIANPLRVALFP